MTTPIEKLRSLADENAHPLLANEAREIVRAIARELLTLREAAATEPTPEAGQLASAQANAVSRGRAAAAAQAEVRALRGLATDAGAALRNVKARTSDALEAARRWCGEVEHEHEGGKFSEDYELLRALVDELDAALMLGSLLARIDAALKGEAGPEARCNDLPQTRQEAAHEAERGTDRALPELRNAERGAQERAEGGDRDGAEPGRDGGPRGVQPERAVLQPQRDDGRTGGRDADRGLLELASPDLTGQPRSVAPAAADTGRYAYQQDGAFGIATGKARTRPKGTPRTGPSAAKEDADG